MEHRNSLGRKLKALRLAAGLTQAQLSAKSEVSQSMISSIELGKRNNPSIHIVRALEKALGAKLFD